MSEPFNVFDEQEWDEIGRVALGPRLGATKLGMSLYELPPGDRGGSYHFEVGCEEWLIVVVGRPTLRTPEGERELAPGEVVCFPDGPAGAHGVRNDGDETARVLFVSTKAPVALVHYPDTKELQVWTRDHGRRLVADPFAG